MDVCGEQKSKHTVTLKEAVLPPAINKDGSSSVAVAAHWRLSAVSATSNAWLCTEHKLQLCYPSILCRCFSGQV